MCNCFHKLSLFSKPFFALFLPQSSNTLCDNNNCTVRNPFVYCVNNSRNGILRSQFIIFLKFELRSTERWWNEMQFVWFYFLALEQEKSDSQSNQEKGEKIFVHIFQLGSDSLSLLVFSCACFYL